MVSLDPILVFGNKCRWWVVAYRSEEHTSELQSHSDLVCRLLLEKKKNKKNNAAKRKKAIKRRQSQERHNQCKIQTHTISASSRPNLRSSNEYLTESLEDGQASLA